jgi:hypothetical protein
MKKALALLVAFAIASGLGAVAITPKAALAADSVTPNMSKTPGNISVSAAFDKIKANGSGSSWYKVSVVDSNYLKSTTINGVTQHYWLLKVYYYSSNWGTVYGYIPYNQDFKTPKNFDNGYFSNGYPSAGQLIDGVFSHDLEYTKYSWSSGYKRHYMYDFFSGRDYTFEYFDYTGKPYFTSNKFTNDDRIIYGRTYWFNDGSGNNELSRIDRKTGAKIVKTNILFSSNQELENGVLLNDHVMAFVSTKNGYRLYIIDLNNLNILQTVTLRYNSTIDITSSPGSLIVRGGSDTVKVDVSTYTGISPAQQAWVKEAQVEDLVKDLSTQPKIDAAQAALNDLKQQVQALPDGADKTQLEQKIGELQAKIDKAQVDLQAKLDLANATLKVNAVEAATADLSTQDAIDNAQQLLTEAAQAVQTLPNSDAKTALEQKLADLQAKIDLAQAELKVNAAEAATADLSTQAQIDNAQALLNQAAQLVQALPDSEAKTALQQKLTDLQAKIDFAQAELKVKEAEAATADLSNTAAIDNAQAAHDAALPYVDRLGESADKTALQQRLEAVQQAIDIARASRAVELAETTIAQNDVDAANALVNALPQGDVQAALQARIAFVQQVIDATAQVAAAEAAEQRLLDALANADLSAKSGVSALEDLLADVQAEIDKATASVNALPTTDKAALADRIAELKERLANLGGLNTQILTVLEDAQHPLQGNGQERHQQDSELRMKPGSTASLVQEFGDRLKELGTGLHYVSFDPQEVRVDANGNVTALSNGMHRVTVFSAKGLLNIYIHVTGNGNTK